MPTNLKPWRSVNAFFGTVLFTSLITLPVAAHAGDICRSSYEPDGQPIDGRFLGVPYAIIGHALAEKYCGAQPRSMRARILGFVEKNGCGPQTEIYAKIESSIAKLEHADLKVLASGGDKTSALSPEDVRRWAELTAKDLGGCTALIEAHDAAD